MRVIGLGQRLGYVVQHGRPPQPQVVAAARDVVQHLERMQEVVLVGVRPHPLHAPQAVQLGEYQLQQPRPLQKVEPYRGHGREDYLVEFGYDALGRDDGDTIAVALDGLEGLLVDIET